MLASVSGCSCPNTLVLVSLTYTPNSSASFQRPWCQYVAARLAMLVSVEGCSCPNTLVLISVTCRSKSSASFQRP